MSSPIQSSSSSSPPPSNLDLAPTFSLTNPRPELPPAIPQTALRKLVASELRLAGFDSAEEEALDELEGLVWSFFGALLIKSHDLAELGRRRIPIAKDVVVATAQLGIGGVSELTEEVHRGDPTSLGDGIVIKYERKVDEVDEEPTLPSDDEDSSPSSSFIASYLPSLPSKHSYRQTPVFPLPSHAPLLPTPSRPTQQTPSAAALAHLSTLRSRTNDSQLVASSLRNLIRRTTSTRMEGEGEDEDVVDFEAVWYTGRNAGRKRKMGVVRVGGEGEGSKLVGMEEVTKSKGGEKRRRWRV